MIREEALGHIKDIICENNTVKHSDMVVFENEKEALYMAIQALSQEPCNDAISREAVLKKQYRIDDSATLSTRNVVNVEDIEDEPSVTQKSGKWIPFSERLPKPFEHCLITTTDGKVIYHYDDGNYSKYKAWMPLPKPYEPQESEKE